MPYPDCDNSPLSGLRVIDLADESASYCGRLLKDLGAEVLKIEPPGGDPARLNGPFLNNQPGPGNSLSCWYFNDGKQILKLDIASSEGRSRLTEMAADCDVIVETYAPGFLAGIGLGFERLAGLNSGLIMASVTGFGQHGPKASYKSCDIVASAAGGQMYVCGRADRAPLKPYGNQAYYLASLFAAAGILLALRWRSFTGRGQQIDISLQEAAAAALDHVLVRHFNEGIIPGRQGSLHWSGSSDLFPCRDGHALVSFNREWDTLVELLSAEGLGAGFRHPAWKDEGFRRRHNDDLDEALSLWTSLKSREEVFKLGQSMRFPWAALYHIPDIFKCGQLDARGYFVSRQHPLATVPFKAPRPVIRFWEETSTTVREKAAMEQHYSQDRLSSPEPVSAPEARQKLPLEGIRVLDFTWMLAGPYATRILADFGAEVIKVQSRRTATGAEDNNSAYFANWNRGKLGITLDMSLPEAREIALALVEKCDVIMENFTPRVMHNWGLNYARVKEVKPDLVMASLSGYGQSGPWRDYAALGPTLQALCGLTGLTSYDSGVPYGLGFAYVDHVAGLYAALAVLAALRRRDRTGQGAYLDISQYEAACSLLVPELLDYSANNAVARPTGNRGAAKAASPYGCYRCRGDDRWCVIAVLDDDGWKALCRAMGDPGLAEDARFADNKLRVQHADELDEVIENWTSRYSPERVADMLQKEGIVASAVQDARDLAGDRHLQERGFFINMNHPSLGEMITDATPMRLSASPAQVKLPAPLLGQHSRDVLLGIVGMDEGRYDDLVSRGIIS